MGWQDFNGLIPESRLYITVDLFCRATWSLPIGSLATVTDLFVCWLVGVELSNQSIGNSTQPCISSPLNAPQSSLRVKAMAEGSEQKAEKSGLRAGQLVHTASSPCLAAFHFPLFSTFSFSFFSPTLSDGQLWAAGREELVQIRLGGTRRSQRREWDKSAESGRDARANSISNGQDWRACASMPVRFPCRATKTIHRCRRSMKHIELSLKL